MIRKHKDNCCYNTCTGQEGTTKNLQGSCLLKKKNQKRRKKKKEKRHPPHLLPPQTHRAGFELFSSLVCYIDQIKYPLKSMVQSVQILHLVLNCRFSCWKGGKNSSSL